jgi:hypothetical protein
VADKLPFEQHPNEITIPVAVVINKERPAPMGNSSDIDELLKICWSHSADQRPNASQVVEKMRLICTAGVQPPDALASSSQDNYDLSVGIDLNMKIISQLCALL